MDEGDGREKSTGFVFGKFPESELPRLDILPEGSLKTLLVYKHKGKSKGGNPLYWCIDYHTGDFVLDLIIVGDLGPGYSTPPSRFIVFINKVLLFFHGYPKGYAKSTEEGVSLKTLIVHTAWTEQSILCYPRNLDGQYNFKALLKYGMETFCKARQADEKQNAFDSYGIEVLDYSVSGLENVKEEPYSSEKPYLWFDFAEYWPSR